MQCQLRDYEDGAETRLALMLVRLLLGKPAFYHVHTVLFTVDS